MLSFLDGFTPPPSQGISNQKLAMKVSTPQIVEASVRSSAIAWLFRM